MLRHDLRNAIKNSQLELYYQPVVNLKTYEIIAAEASVVWSHPEWGTIDSEEFLWIAKEIGFMESIERWVLDQICINYSDWQKNKGLDMKVIVQISSKQFYDKKLLDAVMERMNHYGIDTKFGIIKIDEKDLLENPDKANSILNSFKDAGFKVAMESPGTIQCMNQFDADIMTIDKSFLRKGTLEDKSKIIFENFIKLIRDLDIRLLLEGVENWEQANLLSSLNSVAVKGPLFSEPVCLKEFETMLSKRKCKPAILKSFALNQREERRKYYRIEFSQLLESEMSILRIRDKKVQVGTSRVLIKNIGPGGLCFISDIKFPVEKSIVLQFKTELVSSEIKVYGNIVWTEEAEKGVYVYGLEFTIDETDRDKLVSILNQVQVKMRNDLLFADGNFVSKSASHYFKKVD